MLVTMKAREDVRPAMLDAMETLLLSLGVPASRLNTERFDFV
jgi:hypothetical protein